MQSANLEIHLLEYARLVSSYRQLKFMNNLVHLH